MRTANQGSSIVGYRRLFRTGRDLLALWYVLVVRTEHLRTGTMPLSETAADPANRVYPNPPRP